MIYLFKINLLCFYLFTKCVVKFLPYLRGYFRWSTKKRVPDIGKDNSTFDEVNDFYAFW